MAAFIIIYSFMSHDLHLDGYTKEVYALIFGFWIRVRKPVSVPYSVIRKITGASDPTISECIKRLVKQDLILSDPKPGVRTKYSIALTNEILSAYLRDAGKNETTNVAEELSPDKETTKVANETTKFVEAHKQRKNIQRKDSTPASNLLVSSASSVAARVKTVKIK